MSATVLPTLRAGARRGLVEFLNSARNPSDVGFWILGGAVTVVVLWFNRAEPIPGTDVSAAQFIFPGLLAMQILIAAMWGVAITLSTEREDGTLLRAKAVPHGMTAYVTGQVVLQSAGVVPMLAVLLIPSAILFDGLMHQGALGWLGVAGYLVLGMAACLPIGFIIGSLATSPNKVSTWGMLPVMAIASISGIFVPMTALPGWLQSVGQVFPMYWLGLGMRSSFLPDAAAALEIGGSWRTLETVAVLVAWAVVSLLLLPPLLRRMARRESGSTVEARRLERMQRVG